MIAGHDDDQFLAVEELAPGQWHASDPETGWSTGATTWPDAVSQALVAAIFTNQGIHTLNLDGTGIILLYPEVTA